MTPISAKQYYFDVLAPEEKGKTYQALQSTSDQVSRYLAKEMSPSKLKRWLNWRPVYSNDRLLQDLMNELISLHRDPLKKMLEATFVAKRRSKIANAGAFAREQAHAGDLVVFYVGLSDAAFQYSILYHEFARLREAIRSRDYAAPKRFAARVQALASAQHRWNADGYIQLAPEDMLESDPENTGHEVGVATTTDLFILGHELAHHYLGHTGVDDRHFLGLATSDRSRHPSWESFPEAWRYEFDADSAAIGLVLGANKRKAKDRFVTAALGATLTMTVLGQMDADVDSGSSTHPPTRLRNENILATLRSVPHQRPDLLDAIVTDMTNFQDVLYREQGRGLGKRA
jgi:hypothetical protein